MPTKKPAHAKKPAAAQRRSGLTSALGPKATTMLVIAVLTGGLVVGQIQHAEELAKAREASLMAVGTAGTDDAPAPAPKKTATRRGASTPETVTASNTAPKAPFVTIAGCLERDDESFRLKDTEGADAPKSRSWKSGFLKKGSAAIQVVDSGRVVPLADHVGRRVSVTGTLAGREMRARSVRRLAASCS